MGEWHLTSDLKGGFSEVSIAVSLQGIAYHKNPLHSGNTVKKQQWKEGDHTEHGELTREPQCFLLRKQNKMKLPPKTLPQVLERKTGCGK